MYTYTQKLRFKKGTDPEYIAELITEYAKHERDIRTIQLQGFYSDKAIEEANNYRSKFWKAFWEECEEIN